MKGRKIAVVKNKYTKLSTCIHATEVKNKSFLTLQKLVLYIKLQSILKGIFKRLFFENYVHSMLLVVVYNIYAKYCHNKKKLKNAGRYSLTIRSCNFVRHERKGRLTFLNLNPEIYKKKLYFCSINKFESQSDDTVGFIND